MCTCGQDSWWAGHQPSRRYPLAPSHLTQPSADCSGQEDIVTERSSVVPLRTLRGSRVLELKLPAIGGYQMP